MTFKVDEDSRLNFIDSVTTTATTNLSFALTDALPGFYLLSLLWALNARHRLKSEINPTSSPADIQLIWDLEDNEALVRQIAVLRTHAPRKAVSQLGHQVKMITVSDRANPWESAVRAEKRESKEMGVEEPSAWEEGSSCSSGGGSGAELRPRLGASMA